MKSILYLIKDILKCIIIGVIISLGLSLLASLVLIILYGNKTVSILEGIKSVNYFFGAMGMLLSGGFFMKRDGTRPFIYKEEWKGHFKKMNIGFVIMFIGMAVIAFGVVIQCYIEMKFPI